MRVLVTGSHTRLGAALTRALAASHDVRPLLADPRDRGIAEANGTHTDAIVHLIPAAGDGSPEDALEAIDRATRGTYNLLTTAVARRMVLVTSLRPFERYPAAWAVDERWAPRPAATAADLTPYLAEVTAREVTRVRPIEVVALRLGEVVSDSEVARGAIDSQSLHIDDAVQAVERALAMEMGEGEASPRWHVFHIVDGGPFPRFPLAFAARPPLGYAPRHQLTVSATAPVEAAPPPAPAPPPDAGGAVRRVVIFGAGGPLGAVTATALAPDHELRLTDARPLAEIAAGPPQSPGAPLPQALPAPHESVVVDITDPVQVAAAVAGMDAIVNCTVMRRDPVEAFRVNLLGALNVMRAAVTHSIRRVVQTGPVLTLLGHPSGYGADVAIVPEAPPRPGDNLYFVTKLLGQEVCRIFAEEHGLEVPALLFCNFVNPSLPLADPLDLAPFTISWDEAGAAMRQAVRVPSLPRPFEVLHVNADLPQGVYPNEKAKRLLDWQPRDRLERYWRRDAGPAPADE
jgi:nucleoside-diphosphate-sugar epimerase